MKCYSNKMYLIGSPTVFEKYKIERLTATNIFEGEP